MKFESPVSRWPGHIETDSYLHWPQLLAWEEAIDATKAIKKTAGVGEFYKTLLPVAISLVRKWHIVGLNVDENGSPILDQEGKPIRPDYCNWPASARLTAWLIECVSALYTETNRTDPN